MTTPAFKEALRQHLAETRLAGVPTAEAVRAGLDLREVERMRRVLGLSVETIEHILQASTRTLQRRRARQATLTAAESDRLWRLLHVVALARTAFGDEDAARTWLVTPKAVLGGETPLQRLDTEPGMREVENMLTVIDETSAA